jgi:hypothetical protein
MWKLVESAHVGLLVAVASNRFAPAARAAAQQLQFQQTGI